MKEKKEKWTTTKLIAAGSLGVLLFVLEIIPASINTIAPSTAFAGPLLTFIYSVMIIVCLFLIKEFAASIIMFAIYGILSIPFFLVGPPGFLLKVPVSMVAGLIADLLYLPLRRKKYMVPIIIPGIILNYFAIVMVELAKLFNIPGMEAITKVVYTPVILFGNLAFGAIGGYLGYIIYKKIKNTAVVKRIQS
jgi:hypothetical protein